MKYSMLLVPLIVAAQTAPSSLDFAFFKTRVQPILLAKRPGHARCYVCHSIGAGGFKLQPLSKGATTWNDEQSRLNFEAARMRVAAGDPDSSILLLRPLAEEVGGTTFHSGGKHWDSKSNPEWQILAEWVRGERAAGSK
jgi:hypothetical protein